MSSEKRLPTAFFDVDVAFKGRRLLHFDHLTGAEAKRHCQQWERTPGYLATMTLRVSRQDRRTGAGG